MPSSRLRLLAAAALVPLPLSAFDTPLSDSADSAVRDAYFLGQHHAFTSDFATVQVTPPEGEQVSVNFDLTSLR
jgi:hypothetical protein